MKHHNLLDLDEAPARIQYVPWWRAGVLAGMVCIVVDQLSKLFVEDVRQFIGDYFFEYLVLISFLPLSTALVRIAIWGDPRLQLLKMFGCATIATAFFLASELYQLYDELNPYTWRRFVLPIFAGFFASSYVLAFIVWKFLSGLNKYKVGH